MSLRDFATSSVATFTTAGVHTQAFSPGAGKRVIAVAVGGPGNFNNGEACTGVRFGNAVDGWVTLVQKQSRHHHYVASQYYGGFDLWMFVDDVDGVGTAIPATGDIEVTTTGTPAKVLMFMGTACDGDGVLSYGATGWDGDDLDWNHSGFAVDTGTDNGCTFFAYDYSDYSGLSFALQDYSVSAAKLSQSQYPSANQYLDIGYEDAPTPAETKGARTVGYAGYSRAGTGGYQVVLDSKDSAAITPDPFGAEVGFNAGVLSKSGDQAIFGSRLRGLVVGFNPGALTTTSKRQVAFVGEGLETAEYSEGGTEGQVLTQHVTRPPTWEDADDHDHAKRWVPVTIAGLPVPGLTPAAITEMDTERGTTSATLEDITGATLDIVLTQPGRIAVQMAFSALTTSGGSASTLGVAVNIDSTDHQEMQRYLSGANDRGMGSVVHLTDVLAAGTYTVKGRFRRVTGVSTPGIDILSLVVEALPELDDWQLLFTDGGDVVMMEVQD